MNESLYGPIIERMKSKQRSKMSNQTPLSPFVPYILERGKLGNLIGSKKNDSASLIDPD